MLVSRSSHKIFSLDEAKTFLRVTQNDEDLFIDGLIFDAMQYVETVTGVAVAELTARDYFGSIENELPFSYANAKSVSLVQYLDANNAWQTLDSSLYSLKPDTSPSVLVLEIDDAGFPEVNTEKDQVLKVTYLAGPGAGEERSPLFRRVCFLICGFFYENRQATEAPKYIYEFLMLDRQYHVF